MVCQEENRYPLRIKYTGRILQQISGPCRDEPSRPQKQVLIVFIFVLQRQLSPQSYAIGDKVDEVGLFCPVDPLGLFYREKMTDERTDPLVKDSLFLFVRPSTGICAERYYFMSWPPLSYILYRVF